MIPIGIVTKNRVAYLDVTLRSLTATDVPEGTPVTVFDDHSTERNTLRYYSTHKEIHGVNYPWPSGRSWKSNGLHIINNPIVNPMGINAKVRIERLGKRSKGVVNASCRAVTRLFHMNPQAPGVILLQDDVLFKADWLQRLQYAVDNSSNFTDLPVGVLAGIKLNHRIKKPVDKLAVPTGITAQCLYISRGVYTALEESYFGKPHEQTQRFDDMLRKKAARAGFWAGCIFPFVCQHIGVVSLVRPKRKWQQRPRGRIGYYVHPPYALAAKVRTFA